MGGKSEKSQNSPRIYRDHVMCHFCSLHRNCRSKKCKNTFFLHFGAKHRASAVFSLALHTLQPLTLSCHFWFSIHTKYNMLISQLLLLPLNTTGKMFHSYRNQKSAFSKMPNSVFSEDVKERRWMIIKSLKFSISRCSAKWIYYICLLQGWACHRQIIYPLTPPPILSSVQTAGVLIRFKVWIHLVAWRNSISAPARSQGNVPEPILPAHPQRWHTQSQILYLWEEGTREIWVAGIPSLC